MISSVFGANPGLIPITPPCTLLQIIRTALSFNDIELGLRTKESRHRTTDGLVGESSIVVVDLDRFMTSTSCCRVCQKLCLATFLQADEPEDRRLNRSAHGQQPVILKQSGFLVAQACRNIITLFLGEHDTVEAFIQSEVLRQLHQSTTPEITDEMALN